VSLRCWRVAGYVNIVYVGFVQINTIQKTGTRVQIPVVPVPLGRGVKNFITSLRPTEPFVRSWSMNYDQLRLEFEVLRVVTERLDTIMEYRPMRPSRIWLIHVRQMSPCTQRRANFAWRHTRLHVTHVSLNVLWPGMNISCSRCYRKRQISIWMLNPENRGLPLKFRCYLFLNHTADCGLSSISAGVVSGYQL